MGNEEERRAFWTTTTTRKRAARQTDRRTNGRRGRTSRHYVKGRYQSRCHRIGRRCRCRRRRRHARIGRLLMGLSRALACRQLTQPQRNERARSHQTDRSSSFAFATTKRMRSINLGRGCVNATTNCCPRRGVLTGTMHRTKGGRGRVT